MMYNGFLKMSSKYLIVSDVLSGFSKFVISIPDAQTQLGLLLDLMLFCFRVLIWAFSLEAQSGIPASEIPMIHLRRPYKRCWFRDLLGNFVYGEVKPVHDVYKLLNMSSILNNCILTCGPVVIRFRKSN